VLLMVLLQFSSAQGPAECELAVGKALAYLARESAQAGVRLEILEQEDGAHTGTLCSALISLEGDAEDAIAQRWVGTIQWTCPSPYRPRHARKNWFFGVARCEAPSETLPSEIRFETTRSSGPGGQHVNKTESAVRAIHLATGISVKVQTERSQHANKRLAVLLLAHKLANHDAELNAARRAQRRTLHHPVERGNPSRVFKGERFELVTGG
jgi:peptide chain release factor